MADITPFNFGIFTVRVIARDNQPWFVANDICNALGYSNTSKAIGDHLDEDERYNESLERGGNLLLINESGLYALVLRSRKPEARKFAKWVTREVLPSIRQTGQYGQPVQDTKRIEHARQLAHAATAQVYQAVFDAVLNNNSSPYNTRLLLGFTGTTAPIAYVQALENGAFAMTLPQLTKAIRTDLMVSDTALANLAAACIQRMAERAEVQERRTRATAMAAQAA